MIEHLRDATEPIEVVLEQPPGSRDRFTDFWEMPPEQRSDVLVEAIVQSHAWHFERNPAYRYTVMARGIGRETSRVEFARLLRPTAQTFKSYIDIIGTPFPQDRPQAFLDWLANQLSIELPRPRFERFRRRYPSLEALLLEVEDVFSDYGFEILTSSGTSGRATIMVRDQESIKKTVQSFYLSFQRQMGMQADHRAIFIMPQDTRIAMVRMASFSFKLVGLPADRIHYTIPYPAYPDQVRVRAGRTYREGWRGHVERRLLNPFMNWANESLATPKAVQHTIALLEMAESAGDKVLLFGGWVHLHAVSQALQAAGRTIRLADGSLLGTGGGFKELYPFGPERICQDLARVILTPSGNPIPLRDVYGMAEGNWAAMQCLYGNFHIPPWVYAATLDENDRFHETPDSTGLLAFFDPIGGGQLFPAFFKTADQVRLVNGSRAYDPALDCPCGEVGAYLAQGSIQRVDLMDEAGCTAQL